MEELKERLEKMNLAEVEDEIKLLRMLTIAYAVYMQLNDNGVDEYAAMIAKRKNELEEEVAS